jgi:hypothetical protein
MVQYIAKALNIKNTTQKRGHTFMPRARFKSAHLERCWPNIATWHREEISASLQFMLIFAFFHEMKANTGDRDCIQVITIEGISIKLNTLRLNSEGVQGI